ncbi:hypothetical protein AArcSl_0754 [Halalkaliarchaeum desulfuricum]|uniref:Uncharacterized protein n=2 Tax=Halalkaliarchaeum desulfuricum TaxID=2055893 RepID=A0A343TH28_9EURY|nr:hypothetical protein AArcSl_0754 [Halalkaliarchaeum desulfuricum]
MLSLLKNEDESWDEFLARLARRDRDVEDLGGFADEGVVADMEAARETARGDWDERMDS